jgi:transposase
MGIDIGKNSFHVVGFDQRGAIVLRQKWSRGQVEGRLANMPPCLIGIEACVGAHHLSRKLQSQGHDARLMPAKYVRPYSKGQKNDFRDAEAIAEAVLRPTMRFVATMLAEAPLSEVFLGDQAYDARAFRQSLALRGATVVIPNNPTRKHPHPFDPKPYRMRNAIERMFCQLKDWRRIATRYNKLARNFASAVALVAAIIWWIN